ncbi:MAG TPA: hypothetical protein VE421_07685 [Burkholderiaceae bacterium]|nr:hypothetical protein [Burkholderiaceae bacterium]
MTPLKTLVATAAVVAGLFAVAESASARGRHGHHHGGAHFSFGFWGGPFWGPGYWGPGYWGPGYWSPPAVVYAPAPEPRVWVERDQGSTTQAPPVASNGDRNAPQWWYWCASSQGYYPYVSNCAEGWQRVAPQPQGAR